MKLTYLTVTLGLAVGGWWIVLVGSELNATLVGTGVGIAWAIQAVSFWVLVSALERGGSAVGPWIAGMAGRAAGLVALWLLAVGVGLSGIELVVPYALALLAFLLLEAVWLAVGTNALYPKRKSTET